ncbi:MAG: MiaB/RimO family radical SAM methylthiotransferase [Hyphomicrobiales bacterium]
MKYHLISLGCQMNQSDSERVKTVVEKMGYEWTDREEDACLLGLIACSVRQKAIDKVYSKIRYWNQLKEKNNLITFISGCILPSDRERFLKLFDIIFTMNELPKLPEFIHHYGVVTPAALSVIPADLFEEEESSLLKNQTKAQESKKESTNVLYKGPHLGQNRSTTKVKPEQNIENFWDLSPQYSSPFEAYVPIQNGCDKFCTFCAVPYTRGREVSRSSEEIISEVKSLVNKGYKSITLLGQNVNSYGNDKNGKELSFDKLLAEIGEYGNQSEKKFWLYFTSPHPRDMTTDVIRTIAKYDCIANQIHLPLQSGDDKMLIRMNRKHSLSDYRDIINDINIFIPDAIIFTDIIIGFTGETEEQFENTRAALDEFKFNMAYIALYSPRPGAASSRWNDDVPHEVKKKRFKILTEQLRKNYRELNLSKVGKIQKVLVRNIAKKEGYLSGLTEGKIIVRFPSTNKSIIGLFVDVKITSVSTFSMEGVLVE